MTLSPTGRKKKGVEETVSRVMARDAADSAKRKVGHVASRGRLSIEENDCSSICGSEERKVQRTFDSTSTSLMEGRGLKSLDEKTCLN